MAATIFLGTRFQSLKADGTVNAGGSVTFYEPGTATEKTTYSDSGLTIANASPVVLDSGGCADIWFSGNADVTVKDSTGTTIDTVSDINPQGATSTTGELSLISNGGFESGASGTDPVGWTQTLYTDGTGELSTTATQGVYSWKFISIGTGGGYIESDSFPVSVNRDIYAIWDMYSTVADVRNVVEIRWYDSADAYISTTTLYDDSTTNPTSWTTKTYTGPITPVATARSAKVRLYGCHSSDATAGTTFFDNVKVTEMAHPIANVTAEGSWIFSNALTTIYLADDGATAGPVLKIQRDSASAADADVTGVLRFSADNDAAEETIMAELETAIEDASDGTEDASLTIKTMTAGSLTEQASVANGITIGTPTGSYKGTGTLNVSSATYTNGVRKLLTDGSQMGTLSFGAINKTASASAQFMMGIGMSANSTETNARYSIPYPVTVRDLRVALSAAVPASSTCTVTLRKNGADTALTTTLSPTETSGTDTSNEVDFNTGDLLTLKIVTDTNWTATIDVKASIRICMFGTTIGVPALFLSQGAGVNSQASTFGQLSVIQGTTTGYSRLPLKRSCYRTWYGDVLNGTGYATNIYKNNSSYGTTMDLGASDPQTFEENGSFASEDDILVYEALVGASTNQMGAVITFTDKFDQFGYAPIPFTSYGQAQATTVYMGTYCGNVQSTTESDVSYPVSAGVIKNLFARSYGAITGSDTVVLTLRVNGADTALTTTISSTSQVESDISNSVTVNDGDLIAIKCTTSATSGTVYINASIEHAAP